MKTKYPSMFGLLVALMLVASLVVPANVAAPAPVQADPDVQRWSIVDTPNSVPPANLIKELWSPRIPAPLWTGLETGSELADLAIASDGLTMYVVVTSAWQVLQAFIAQGLLPAGFWPNAAQPGGVLGKTGTGGWIWSPLITQNLAAAGAFGPVWDVEVAPDDPDFVVVITSDPTGFFPSQLWVSDDGGTSWDSTFIENFNAAPDYLSCVDISPDYGGQRDIAVGTRDGTGYQLAKVWTIQVPGFGNWLDQSSPAIGQGDPNDTWNPAPFGLNGDILDIKFSPTYVGDATLTLVGVSANVTTALAHTDAGLGCFWRTAVRDLDQNTSDWQAPVYISDPSTNTIFSATANEAVDGDLDLPSDFSGQAASLRRAYISLDDGGGVNAALRLAAHPMGVTSESGIYRVDDTTVYELMDTSMSTINGTRISSIAYYGTYASGKLLAGEVIGDPCWATVPTWFTDSPTTCPIPCWYPAKKPTTGAAGWFGCGTLVNDGYGNAQVLWSPDGATAYVATGAPVIGPWAVVTGAFVARTWPDGLRNIRRLDESGFALSRNNGETWNQLAMIDTRITKLTDVAPAPDCTTIYLASTNNGSDNWFNCDGFESVWRSSANPAVASPLPPLGIGNVWERVLCRPSATTCNIASSDYAILRLAPDKEDGQIVFWAAGGAQGGGFVAHPGWAPGLNTQAVAWSPDYGDYWANINPRLSVQDMAAESSTTLYILSTSIGQQGLVQRMPYTGTAWSSAIPNGNTSVGDSHTIAALAEGNVLVGGQDTANVEASYSRDSAATWSPAAGHLTPIVANNHVIFDPNFADNGIMFLAEDDNDTPAAENAAPVAGVVYRNTVPWGDFTDLLNAPLTPAYCRNGYTGLVAAHTGEALYGSHNGVATVNAALAALAGWCTVERTIYRYWPVPKPNVPWDHMDVGTDGYHTNVFPEFTLEPSALKYCGCLTLDTDTELFAIDDAAYSGQARVRGMLWAYTDCLAKVGPTLIMEEGTLIGCDPVSGRNQEINFTWEQLCLAIGYDVEIAKDEAFTLKVVDYISTFAQATVFNVFVPQSPMSPAWLVPADAGQTTWAGQTAVGTQPGMYAPLECGHKYFWKVKVRGDAWGGTIRSPWSEVRSFTIKAGLPVTTPYYGPQLLSPNNGCIGCPTSPASFSWSPFKGSTSYQFQLASDAAMTSIVAEDTVPTTAYEYSGTLDYSTNYFWRVMSVEPAPSDWSATFSFQTAAAPEEAPAPAEAPATPIWVWVVIALGAILVIVTLVLIFKTRRV